MKEIRTDDLRVYLYTSNLLGMIISNIFLFFSVTFIFLILNIFSNSFCCNRVHLREHLIRDLFSIKKTHKIPLKGNG